MTLPPRHRSGDRAPQYPDTEVRALVDYLSGEGTTQARATMQRRLADDPAFAAFAQPLVLVWHTPRPASTRDLDAGWAVIQRRAAALQGAGNDAAVPRRSPRHQTAGRRWYTSWSTWMAVALLLVVGYPFLRAYVSPVYQYQGGSAGATVTLPDGSVATLTPGSYLGTEHGFQSRNRTVYLFGEAHFTVAHNPQLPFVVYVPGVGARALGTSFGMQADTLPQVRVDVSHGAVAVEARDAHGHWHAVSVLKAGQAVQVPVLEAWLAQAGYDISAAGVPIRELARIEESLRRAVVHAGAAAARARQDSTRK